MKSDLCFIRWEHCPYCGAHDTIAIFQPLEGLLRGETFWCGYCHSTFTDKTTKKRERGHYNEVGTEGA